MKSFVVGTRGAIFVALATALVLGMASPASAQMKEGTVKGTYFSFGTVKATPIGKERLLLAFDANGLSVTNGFLDHMAWHCSGLGDYTNGMGQDTGFCAGNDPAGDQVVFNWGDGKHPADQKVVSGTFTYTTGTGKYAGISGGGTYVSHGGEFRPVAEGTSVDYVTFEGSYKLP